MMRKRLLAILLVILTIGCLSAMAEGEGRAVSDAASGVARIVSIDEGGRYRGASAFGIGAPGEPTDTFVTTYSAVTDENGAPVAELYLLLEDVKLTVTAITPYQTVNKADTVVDAITGQDESKTELTIERGQTVEGFDPQRQARLSVLFSSSDQNFAVLRADHPVEGRVALSLEQGAQPALASAISLVGYPDPVATYASERHELRSNKGWWTVETAEYTLTASSVYVNCTTGFINQYDPNGGASFLHSAVTNSGSDGGALVMETGEVAGVASALKRLEFAAVPAEEAQGSDFTGVYIEDVISLLERRGIAFTAEMAAAGEPTPEPTVEPAPEPTPEPTPEPSGWERLVAFLRENALLVAIVAVLVVLILIVVAALVKGRHTARRVPLVAEDVSDEPETVPAPAMEVGETMPVNALCLRGVSGELRDRVYPLENELRIGRDPRRNNVAFPLQTKGVSSVHCVVSLRDGHAYVEDEGSTYGTFVNGTRRLSKGQIFELRVGDRIAVGSEREVLALTNKGGN